MYDMDMDTQAIWTGTFFQQKTFDRSDAPLNWDFTDTGTVWGPIFLYTLYGILDAMLQTSIYWLMGALSNDATTLARYAAFYKAVQSAGSAVSWSVDNMLVSYMNEMIINWVLTSFGLVLVFIVASYGITETQVHLENLPVEQQLQIVEVVTKGQGNTGTPTPFSANLKDGEEEYTVAKGDD
jgi:hypothetical protein